MSDIKAVRLLSVWAKDRRPTVSVTKADYDELLYKVPPIAAAHTGDGTVHYVILDKQTAVDFLMQEYNLHGICGNTTRE